MTQPPPAKHEFSSTVDGNARFALGVAVLVGVLAALALPANAQSVGEDVIKWPQLLPPAPTTTEVQPGPVPRCKRATIRCVGRLARGLRRQWLRFDASCDHRAVIAYSYLRITRGLRADLARPRPGLVKQRRWMTYLITTFSNRYFAAFRDYREGRPVPAAWRRTFEAAAKGDANAGQDVLLFSNAHVQHDLPFALEEMGLRARSGRSRKPDHDAVNAINAAVFDPIEKYIAAHYDPSFALFDLPVPAEELGVLELIKSWREGAWRNAERLLNAETRAARRDVVRSIQATSQLWANLISSGGMPGTRESRDSFCRAQQARAG